MNDLLYTLDLICKRRGVNLSKVESVAFNVYIAFGLADETNILPAVANTFYYAEKMTIWAASITGTPLLRFLPNSGQGSAGDPNMLPVASSIREFNGIEMNSLVFDNNNMTAGSFYLCGTVFKITYA